MILTAYATGCVITFVYELFRLEEMIDKKFVEVGYEGVILSGLIAVVWPLFLTRMAIAHYFEWIRRSRNR